MSDAVPLAVTRYDGPSDALPLIILHGLFGNRRNWARLAKEWAAERRVICADLRNHGQSPWTPDMDYPAMAGDIAALIEAETSGRALLLGHSLGGKAAMMTALTWPDSVAGLIVVDIAPVAYDRPGLDGVDAMLSVDPSAVDGRAAADRALAPIVPDPAMRAFLLSNLERNDAGGFRWRVNLDVIAKSQTALLGFPDSPRRYSGPALAIAGQRSDYVTGPGIDAFRDLFPAFRLECVSEAGHWVHADRPEEVVRLVADFVETL